MDGSVEHSDSDSGDSWTLLDSTPAYTDEVPELPESKLNDIQNIEKDEDTDEISIISESEPEPSLPSENSKSLDEITFEPQVSQYIRMETTSIDNDNMLSERIDQDDFLIDNSSKHKTYVHRRNKRLSTVLNIIVLGSVITAAGVAIGHMWGAKNDCSINTTPSVNKILSNLYKLQEENSYLRNKIKELTLLHHRKSGTDTLSSKPKKCKKLFEDSLYNKNTDTPIKCVDNEDIFRTDMHLVENKNKNDFLHDIDKLKNIYRQNKSWLDNEISKRLRHEERTTKSLKTDIKSKNTFKESQNLKGEMLETINEVLNTDAFNSNKKKSSNLDNSKSSYNVQERKISYADSLKSDLNKISNVHKKEANAGAHNYKMFQKKKKLDLDNVSGHAISEDEFQKDDRYVEYKNKPKRKKHDRQKLHKNQKRRNKYEQWELKGGYLNDYDDFSVTSSQNHEYVENSDKVFVAKDIERENYISKFLETNKNKKSLKGNDDHSSVDPDKKSKTKDDRKNEKHKENQTSWYDKRAMLRNEARKKLEYELFGETSPNNAGWYFRRMHRREQCRAKGDNSTHRKLSKRNMNFKTKQ